MSFFRTPKLIFLFKNVRGADSLAAAIASKFVCITNTLNFNLLSRTWTYWLENDYLSFVSKDGWMQECDKRTVSFGRGQISPEKLIHDLLFVGYPITFRRNSFFTRRIMISNTIRFRNAGKSNLNLA